MPHQPRRLRNNEPQALAVLAARWGKKYGL
jgi:hypothetical protein